MEGACLAPCCCGSPLAQASSRNLGTLLFDRLGVLWLSCEER